MAIRPWEIDRQRGVTPVRPASVFSPTSYDWAAEGSGSTSLTAAQRAALTNTRAENRKPGGVFNPVLENLGSTGPQVDDKPDPAPTTNGVTGGNPYPAVLPPLTPEMQATLDARRRAASRAYEQAAIEADDARIAAQAQRLFTERQIDEATARSRREGMKSLAARGLARSPMFANPFRRELVRQQQEQLGQAEATLAGTLEQLGRTLQAAELKREREYADVGLAAMQARSNIARLLGLS